MSSLSFWENHINLISCWVLVGFNKNKGKSQLKESFLYYWKVKLKLTLSIIKFSSLTKALEEVAFEYFISQKKSSISWNSLRIKTRGAVALWYFPSMGSKKDWSNVHQISFKRNPNIDKIISIEKLSEEFKPIVSERFLRLLIDEIRKSIVLLHFQPINTPACGAN